MMLYLIEILHQTTTTTAETCFFRLLYLIEILHQTTTTISIMLSILCCILSKFYIKPQLVPCGRCEDCCCILSKFYIKPQPQLPRLLSPLRCILSKFYIKPQLPFTRSNNSSVVSYRNSTSNHNLRSYMDTQSAVVSYRNSTSNHNKCDWLREDGNVVSYRNSTSNHNNVLYNTIRAALYLIEILHQTTTNMCASAFFAGCILSKFYIKPQRPTSTR